MIMGNCWASVSPSVKWALAGAHNVSFRLEKLVYLEETWAASQDLSSPGRPDLVPP